MKLTLYHTNDIHSHLHEYARISAYMAEHRPKLNHASLYLDLGDHVDLSLPLTEATEGLKNVELLNKARCDLATIGNNEGMTISHEALNRLYDNAQFPVTCANVYDERGHLPRNLTSSYFLEIEGVRFLFVAATAPFTPFYRALDWVVTDPLEAIKDEILSHQGQYDVLIVMSHVGIFFDEKLCQELPEIDLILGSHTHHYFEEGEEQNGVLMAAAGKYGHYLGEVTLEINDKRVVRKCATLHPVDDLPEVETHFIDEGKALMNTSVIKHPIHLPRTTDRISKSAYILAESVMEFTHTQGSIINAGLIVKDLSANEVTEYDVHQMLPHPINAVRIRLKGSVLKSVILKSQKQEYLHEHAQGLGFRGDIFGGYVLYNIGYIESEERFFIDGEEIDDDETYSLGTIDMYTFGRYFPMLKGEAIEYIMPEFLRDIFKEKLMRDTDI
ncbi:bifunctional metallophosphatase/5'-nucleotidase [Staphylococcus sp. SQ8-PEA]|uniref:Bifunctional metallophosphatase/5'-nucleotidase n=1 Tax=Staphylococcus marylandisciuri TaxID=2981529 RepID=A0ABT2QPM5_9STAP|nr:bifunctional UDP-sugar hydrolase/5'-nucleotidase [Staphylococcus marylandisciuri]MCU5745930.1 bifunctional metallophosphatase/5'-nucleotidase [Staphylococcus marylandisciuri]